MLTSQQWGLWAFSWRTFLRSYFEYYLLQRVWKCHTCIWKHKYRFIYRGQWVNSPVIFVMGLLPDTQYCVLRMRRECRERFPRHRLQRKTLVSDPDMHHGACVTHEPWCMSGSLSPGCEGNVPVIPGACKTRIFPYLSRGAFPNKFKYVSSWLHCTRLFL